MGGAVDVDLGHAPVRHPGGPGTVEGPGVSMVGKPFQPLPVLRRVVAEHGDDLHVLGTVQHRQLADHRPRHPACRGDGAADRDPRMAVHVDDDRHVAHRRPTGDEAHHRVCSNRVDGLRRLRLRTDQLGRQRDRAEPDTNPTEVGIVGSSFPHPPAADQSPQHCRIGMTPVHRPVLSGSGSGGRVIQCSKVTQVFPPVPIHLPRPAGAA